MPIYKEIICAKCRKTYSLEETPPNDGCGGRIEFLLDLESIKEVVNKRELERRKGGLSKYIDFMPLVRGQLFVSLGEGGTPLLRSARIGSKLRIKNLMLKNETTNPTGSFKDRPICIGVNRAIEDKASTVITASSGNAAASMAAYAARGGLRAIVLVPETVPAGKLVQLTILGAQVFKVKEREKGVDPTTSLLWETRNCEEWIPVPSFGPFNCFQFEGTKSLGYEIAEQCGWNSPDWIFFPTGSGGLMAGTMKGFWEFAQLDFIDKLPRPVVVQPEGCAPIVRAFSEGKGQDGKIERWGKPKTICGGLADPFPWDGDAALEYLKRANGFTISVSDKRVEKWVLELGKLEGIFGEPSGVAALAALEVFVEQGIIDKADHVVIPITGVGFKDITTVQSLTRAAPIIEPNIEELMKHLN